VEYTLCYSGRVKAVILRDTATNYDHHHLSIDKALNRDLLGTVRDGLTEKDVLETQRSRDPAE